MEIFQGIGGFGNVALGNIKIIENIKLEDLNIGDSKAETEKYELAKNRVLEELYAEQKSASHSLDAHVRFSMDLDSQLMLLNDHQLEDAIYGRILSQNQSAYQAIKSAGEYMENMLSSHSDSYLQSKSNDIKEITRRLLTCLDGYSGFDGYLLPETIIATKTLSSADFLKLDKDKVVGLIVEQTSGNSHMAILAKAMGIPTIIGCEIDSAWDGKPAVVDGGWRALYIEPDEQTVSDMRERMNQADIENQKLMELRGKKCVSKDGKTIELFANVSSTRELQSVIDNDARGIGLYRTEPAYVNRSNIPSEEELFIEYRTIANAMGHMGVTIRTVDIGVEMSIPYIKLSVEKNAALGCRGIRLCLRNTEIFKPQLRAILRAACYGNLSIMFPMISSMRELIDAKELLDECYKELMSQEIPCKMVSVGVMIETPAAVMISDELSKHVDFMSIGTNDLTQYTLGADRENKELADIIDYHHPAILKMIKIVVDNGHKNNTPVGICGELAADDELTRYFLDIGVDSLSIAPSRVLPIRNHIIEM